MPIWFAEKIRNLLWNVYQYYCQFVPNVNKFISDTRKTISDAVKVFLCFTLPSPVIIDYISELSVPFYQILCLFLVFVCLC